MNQPLLLAKTLALERCPHCEEALPNLSKAGEAETHDGNYGNQRIWGFYSCASCGGVVSAWAYPSAMMSSLRVHAWYPQSKLFSTEIPERPLAYLQQARESVHAPAGAVMLAAAAVDSMLKERGLIDGSLYARIEKAVTESLITKEMSKWAHSIRLDANDQRHADKFATLPSREDAERSIDFAAALGEILFVLPARVKRGIENGSEGAQLARVVCVHNAPT